MGASELDTDNGAAEPVDRLAVETLCGVAFADQGARTSLYPQCPVGATGACHFRQALDGVGSTPGVPAADGRLDEFDVRPGVEPELLRRMIAYLPGRGQRLLVPVQAIAEHGAGPLRDVYPDTIAAPHSLAHIGDDHV